MNEEDLKMALSFEKTLSSDREVAEKTPTIKRLFFQQLTSSMNEEDLKTFYPGQKSHEK